MGRKIFDGSLKKRLVIGLLLLIFFVQTFTAIASQSSTWDETVCFGIGKYLLSNLRWDVPGAILHPPLPYYISSLPLLFSESDKGLWEYRLSRRTVEFLGSADVFRGQALLSSPQNRNDRLLILSRLMVTVFGLLLGYFIYLFGNSLYGEESGILSLLLFAFCPNMVAFSGLIVPDMVLTVFFLISVYYLWLSLRSNETRHFVLAGLSLGLALLSKFTALILIPIEVILICAFVISEKTAGKFVAGKVLFLFFFAAFILFFGYGFNPLPYFQGIDYQWSHAARGHAAFLAGRYSASGWWYYFLFAFLVKTPIPLLVIFLSALFMFFSKADKETRRPDELFLLLPILITFGFFSVKHQSIGLRYILPVYPFVFVFAGRLLRYPLSRISKCSIAALVIWAIVASFHISPHYLSYFNEIVGGPENGYKYLIDSNLDWGQDLKGLKKFMEENKIDRISLSYFGSDSPKRYGIEYDWLPSYVLENPNPKGAFTFPEKGLLAVSATNLQGVYFRDHDIYKWLERYKPAARIGYSIFVYDLSNLRPY